MSRVTKWRLEKTKVKVVFRLQFHATHVPQSGWDKLFISLIPADSGKATAKTNKANVRNGTCKWSDPIYETTRLLLDTKTKQYDEKLYKVVVAMGSSRSSILGEANINLADYVDAMKPSSVALVLLGCDSGTTLHVTVQLLTSKTGFREFEQQRELREGGLPTTSSHANHDERAGGKGSSSEGTVNDQMVQARVRFKPETKQLPSLQRAGMNDEYSESALGYDGSSNTSESLYAEKHDTSSTNEIESLKSTTSGDLGALSLAQSPQQEKVDPSDRRFSGQGTNDWVHGCGSEYSVDNDLASVYEENGRLRGSLEAAESSILELRQEVASLRNQADEIGVETRIFSQQLANEIISGEDLAKEVSSLKSECLKLKDDLVQHRSSKTPPFSSREHFEPAHGSLFQDLPLKWLGGILVMEDKIKELQNKASFGVLHEGDTMFLQSDLGFLLGALQDLKQVSSEKTHPQLGSANGFDADLCPPEGVLHCLSVPGIVSNESDPVEATNSMKGKIFELIRELDESKAERESLVRKMNQMECYYEALIHELEENQRQMLGELQNLRKEHSTCLYTLSSTKGEMEAMRHDMNEQMLKFAEDKCEMDYLNKEFEKRAITAEAALKRARLNYSIAVDHLQKDLEVLSFQVLSMFETNENLIRQSLADPSEIASQMYSESVLNQTVHLKEFGASKLLELQNRHEGIRRQHIGGDMLLEDLKKSLHLQEGLYQKVEEEVCEMHLANVSLDVFSKTLQVSLLEASADIRLLQEKFDEATQQLELSIKSNESLSQGLQIANDDIHSLNQYKVTSITACNEMALQKQNLEASLHNVTSENRLLTQKLSEWEALMTEYRSYQSRYEACTVEKEELANLLKKETHENGALLNEVSSLQEVLKSVRSELDELALCNKTLEVNLQDSICENQLLTQKLTEREAQVTEYRGYESKYESCTVEKTNLAKLLGEETLENGNLRNEVSTLQEELKSVRSEFDELVSRAQNLEANLQDLTSENQFLTQKVTDGEALMAENGSYEKRYESCLAEKMELADLLKKGTLDNGDLRNEISNLQEDLKSVKSECEELASVKKNLQNVVTFLQEKLWNLLASYSKDLNEQSFWSKPVQDLKSGDLETMVLQLEDVQHTTCEKILQFVEEKKVLIQERDLARESLSTTESDVLAIKEKFENDTRDVVGKLDMSGSLVQNLQLKLEAAVEKVNQSTETEEKYLQQHKELFSGFDGLEVELQQLASRNGDLAQEILALQTLSEELERSELNIAECSEKNRALETAIQNKTVEYANLVLELTDLKGSFQSLHDELCTERSLRNKLESSVEGLTSQLNEKDCLSLHLDQQKTELAFLKQQVTELELEKSRACHLLLQYEESLQSVNRECVSANDLEMQLSEMYEYSVAADITLAFTRSQYEAQMEELVRQLNSSNSHLTELHEKHLELETLLNGCLAGEAQYIEENARLTRSLDSIRSELKASISHNRVLLDSSGLLSAELEEYKNRAANLEVRVAEDKNQYALEVEELKRILVCSEEEIDELILSNEELEIKVLVLNAKLDENGSQMNLTEQYNDEIKMLQDQINDLTRRLSEQTLKTEEFKNLSVHLRELKDKADAESLQAREKKEPDGPAGAMQESLRIAFIKEQYETRLQELKHQLMISKKHSDEMLWKLQDAIGEIENRKKSEASHLKKNEELGMQILELESELQSVLSDKREKVKANDLMKAELECSLISLECCKEEKQKLEVSLQECNEKFKIVDELTLTKKNLKSSSCPVNIQNEKSDAFGNDPLLNDAREAENSHLIPVNGGNSSALVNVQQPQDAIVSSDVNGVSSHAFVDPENGTEQLALINDHFRAETLKCTMDHLNKELERMKSENSHLLQDDNHFTPKFPGLEQELTQLQKVNEELGGKFPSFNDFSASGNPLERVLALELELAEALQAKKKSSLHFQSSFLKQHSDEEAVFKSFRDINDLIKETLDIKGRYAAVETELKEMHDRYSQLSLQFAEVEGERQKLMMTLKNVRGSKKVLHLNRSSSASLSDHS